MAWSIRQASINNGSTAALTNTYSSNVIAGTKLVVFVMTNAGVVVNSVKDGAGNSFVQQATVTQGVLLQLSCWALDTPAGDVGTAPTITANIASSNFVITWISEVSGLAAGTSGIVDGTAGTLSNFNGVFTTVGPPTYTDSVANEALFYVYADNGVPVTAVQPSGYTLDPNINNGSPNGNLCVSTKNSTGGTETGAWSFSGGAQTFTVGDAWGLILLAFKLPSVGSVPGPPLYPHPWNRVATQVFQAGSAGAKHSR